MRRLAYNARVDTAILATGAVWLGASELLKAELVPEKCRWCYRRKDGSSALNVADRSVREHLKWKDESTAGTLSSIIAFGFMPGAAIGGLTGSAAYDGALRDAPVDALLTAEATILAADLNQLVKFVFVRERPFVHFLPRAPDGVRAATDSPSDDNLAFYSGHTNLAFAIAASSSTIALMRGYRLAPLVLGVGAASAISVGYLRIAADKHYFSDVVTGAVLGTLIGALVPFVFHPVSDASPTSVPSTMRQPLAPMHAPFTLDGTW